MSKFLFLLEVPTLNKGCGVLSLKLATQISAIATLAYILFTFFFYYEADGVQVRNQFYFYLIQIYGAVSVSFLLYSTIKKDEIFANLGLYLHNIYVAIRVIVFLISSLLILFYLKFGDFFMIIIYAAIEFLAMIYFNYIFYCFVKTYDENQNVGENRNVAVSENNYVPPSDANQIV